MKGFAVTAGCAVALLCACQRAETPPTPAAEPPVVEVIEAASTFYRPAVHLSGVIAVTGKAEVTPGSEGRITELYVDEGDRVQQGQELGRMDDTRLLIRRRELEADIKVHQHRVRLARAALAAGERDVLGRLRELALHRLGIEDLRRRAEEAATVYNTKKALVNLGGVSRRELERLKNELLTAETELSTARGRYEIEKIGLRKEDLAAAGIPVPVDPTALEQRLVELNTAGLRAEIDSAVAELEKARVQLESLDLLIRETRLLSPINGIIGLRMLGVGEKAGPEKPVYTVFADGGYYAVAEVSESDLPLVREGLTAEVVFSEDRSIDGYVETLAPYVDPESRSAKVKVFIHPENSTIRPGMYVRIKIYVGPAIKIIRLPRSAVTEGGEVYVYADDHLFSRPVEYRMIDGNTVAIEHGLKEGEIVCKRIDRFIRDGARVRPRS